MKNILLAVILAVSLAGCGSVNSSKLEVADTPLGPPKALGASPQFELENLAGGILKSADLKDKVVIVDFWATWCSPCVQEIPNFNALQAEYQGKSVQMLGITVESGSLDDVKPFIEKYKIKYPVVMGDEAVVEGFGGVIGFPTTFVVGKDGQIYKKFLGNPPNKKEQLRKLIETLSGA